MGRESVTLDAVKTLWPETTPLAESPWTFDRLYAARAQQVAAWAQRLGGPAIDVDDVVQEVFVVVHQRLPELSDLERLTTWLFRLTANKVRHQRRAARWRRLWGGVRGAPGYGDGFGDALETALCDPRALASETLETREAEAQLYRCLDQLKEAYRVPLILFELEHLPCEEIAQRLGLTLGAVWTRIHRGRGQLLAQLRRCEALDAHPLGAGA